jgi:hypothetical protein
MPILNARIPSAVAVPGGNPVLIAKGSIAGAINPDAKASLTSS